MHVCVCSLAPFSCFTYLFLQACSRGFAKTNKPEDARDRGLKKEKNHYRLQKNRKGEIEKERWQKQREREREREREEVELISNRGWLPGKAELIPRRTHTYTHTHTKRERQIERERERERLNDREILYFPTRKA